MRGLCDRSCDNLFHGGMSIVFRQRTATIFYEPFGIEHSDSSLSLRFVIHCPIATRTLKRDRKRRPHITQDACHDGEVIERNNRSGCSHITGTKMLQLIYR
jgi:hypothetical protein